MTSQKKLYKYDRDESYLYFLCAKGEGRFATGKVPLTEDEYAWITATEKAYYAMQRWLECTIKQNKCTKK